MNPYGALIVDPGQTRVWTPRPDMPQVRYTERDGTTYIAPDTGALADELLSTVEATPRRTPRERYQSMLNKVLPDMLRAYHDYGQMPEWPRSLQAVLAYIAERDHDPTLTTMGGVDQVIRQGKALVAYLSETGARQQAEADSKMVTLNWSGH